MKVKKLVTNQQGVPDWESTLRGDQSGVRIHTEGCPGRPRFSLDILLLKDSKNITGPFYSLPLVHCPVQMKLNDVRQNMSSSFGYRKHF